MTETQKHIDSELQRTSGTNFDWLNDGEKEDLEALCEEHGIRDGVRKWQLG